MHTRANRIVPLWAEHMLFHLQRLHDGIGNPLAGLVNPLEQAGDDPQTRGGRGMAQIAEHGLKGPQGLPRPIETDLAE